ncbi:MAG TPA: hypothetical protein PLN52_06430 [Opitutaceae bacterium]|nr:hypothetical protein [Opitutaceae bacterium]
MAAIGAINLNSDYVYFDGVLSARTIGAVTLTGGSGINSNSDTAVKFGGKISATTIDSITASASSGNVVFAPSDITGIGSASAGQTPVATITNGITLSTAGTNNGGDITLGNGALYDVNTGNITITAGHKLFASQAGAVVDNPGNVTIDLATSGNIGNLTATTTTGNINNALVVQGNAGNITYTAGAAVVTDADDVIGGPGVVGDLARFGSITANQTIWGTRGVTTFETYGQNADGTAKTLPEFTVGGVTYKILPTGSINATLNYAGASTASGDAFIAKTGGGNATINYNIISNDDNNDGVIAISEIGNGGNVNVSSVSGDISFTARTSLPDVTHVSTLGNVSLKTGTYAQASGLLAAANIGDINFSFDASGAGGFEGKVGNITATTTGGDIVGSGDFDGIVGAVTLTTGAVAHTGGVAVGDINLGGGLNFNQGAGLVKATVIDIGTITGTITSSGTTAGGIELNSQYGAINATVGAGSFDANGNGITTANEFGRTGDVTVKTQGGVVNLTLNSNAYTSDLEQSMIGNVTIDTVPFINVKAGAADVIGTGVTALGSAIAGANGAINIAGAGSQVGAVGNITATTTVANITQSGTFGDVGTVTYTTSDYFDADTNPNVTGETPVLIGNGSIVANGTVNGKHGQSKYSVTQDGTISGSISYGGAATSAESLTATSAKGNISLTVYLHDADRDNSGNITANEYGTFGSSTLSTTNGGDITLNLGTNQNNAAVLARSLVPQFTFGDVKATVVDRLITASASVTDTYDVGNITISGVGADATPATAFGAVTGNRGTVGNITAGTQRGNLALTGNFGSIGDQNLTVTGATDAVTGGTSVVAGSLTYSPSIWGTAGTATLRSVETGTAGNGVVVGGGITGTVNYGGSMAAGKTVAIDAKTETKDITLTVNAKGYDLNGDGLITDGVDANIPGEFEFAKVGNIVLETTKAGDIILGVGTSSADGSKVGSSIGNISAIADDDIITEKANAADTIVTGNVTITGVSAMGSNLVGGTVGDVNIVVKTGNAILAGNFNNIGATSITTSSHTDTSGVGGVSGVQASGNIKLGTTGTASGASAASLPDTVGSTTLNIAGSYKTSTLTVADLGTITGLVFVAGQGTNDWSLTSDKGVIDVGFIAGFDANGSGGTLAASEAGALGSITAKSNVNANVTIGVGGRATASTIGNVSVMTGDVVTAETAKVDTFVSGNATIKGLGTNGTVGNLMANVKTGVATLTGSFGGVGNVVFRTEAATDADSAAGAGEETIVVKAGDIDLNAVEIWGAHGTLDLVTVDSSALAAGKSALAGTVTNTGNITGSVTFSGGLAAGVTSGIVAKTDRGTFNVAVTAGKDEATFGTYQATEAGVVGDVSVQSTDGAVTLSVLNYNNGSSFGNIALSSGTTWRDVAEAADVAVSTGTVTLLAPETTGNKAYGTVGNISLTTATGAATIGAAGAGNAATFNNVGTITVTTSAKTDADTAPGLGELPTVIAAGDIAAYVAAYGTHNTISLTTVDNALAGAPALGGVAAGITGAFTSFGSLAAGSTDSVVLSTQQGNIAFDVSAATRTKVVDGAQGTNTTADDATTNSDDIVGSLGNVSMTSSFGNISTNLNSAWVPALLSSDVGRAAKIGNVTLSTGSSFEVQLGAGNDIAQLEGAITIGGTSSGEIGNLTATTQTGNITSTLGLNNKAGNIAFTSAAYVDGGTEISAGDISLGGTYAALSSTTIGNITLKAQGAGTVAAAYTADVAWVDADTDNTIDAGEQRTFTSGSLTAEAVNGNITFGVDVYNVVAGVNEKEGFGSTLGAVSLTTTGTGSIAVADSTLRVAEIADFSAVSGGGITVDALTTWDASKITKIALTANKGDITSAAGSRIALDFANATNNKTTSLELVDLKVNALDGNINWSSNILAFNGGIGANAQVAFAAGASDNRTFKFTNVAFTALNGATDNAGVDGNITVNGLIGSEEVTSINAVTFTTSTPTDDRVTLNSTAEGANIWAHDLGTITFNSNTVLTGTGNNIVADDSQTSRQLIGSKNYSAASTGTTPGKGSNLDSIASLVFNGAVQGGAAQLLTSTTAEIRASQIGSITVNAKVDPSFTFLTTISNLDVKVGPGTGEFIAENAAAASATGYNQVTAFTVGDISITHDLYAPAAGTAVFGGSNVFSVLGGMGKLTIDSKQNGNFQAPLFAAGSNGDAIFALADYNDAVGAATGAGFTNVVDAAGAAALLPDGKISVGAVYVNAGSSAAVPPQVADIGNAGGGTGHGFVLAVAAVGDGTANVAFTPGNASAIDVTRGLYGYVSSVEFRNNGVRPDEAGNNIVAVNTNTVAAGGTVVVAGDGTAAADIGDIVNEASAPAIQPITENFEYLVGDDDGNDVSNEDDVIVYVL